MSAIKRKSGEYLNVAQYLIDSKHYTESVHCSYYSCFFLMKYYLHHYSGQGKSISYSEQDKKREDSHEYILKEINNRISKKNISKDVCQFFRFLKQERINADYTDKQFSDMESLSVIDTSKGLQAKLKQAFGI